jgi:plastocyanin
MLRAPIPSLLIGLAAASALLLGSGNAEAAPLDDAHATHTVVIEAVRFDPSDLNVNIGDTIVWINRDPFPHTVTAVGRQFDSHEIAPGKSWKYLARKAGVFAYACALHPTMLATLRVK